MLKPFQKPFNTSLPTIYLITPTYDRIEQKAELTRLYYTLLHVPNIHWIIVEDSDKKTDKVRHFLAKCQIPYTHLNVATPQQVKLKSSDPNWLKPRGVLQRNAGLTWIRASLDPQKTKGVVYFADDDNTYSIELFEEVIYELQDTQWVDTSEHWNGSNSFHANYSKTYLLIRIHADCEVLFIPQMRAK